MMAKKAVSIIDYGFGNVRSVLNALERSGLDPTVVSQPEDVANSENLVLPGVGAFATAMNVIVEQGLADAIHEAVNSGAKVLGICLGMQLLFERSFEFGEHSGLGILEGSVGPLVAAQDVSPRAKSTHISWTRVDPESSGSLADWFSTQDDEYYFVHSFAAQQIAQDTIAGISHYRGNPFVSAVEKDNIAGVQFHPERSGEAGLRLLSHFFADAV